MPSSIKYYVKNDSIFNNNMILNSKVLLTGELIFKILTGFKYSSFIGHNVDLKLMVFNKISEIR